MTEDRLALFELIDQSADSDLVRDMLAFAAGRLMEMEVEARTGAAPGARSADRKTCRNGYRERAWETRAGRIDLDIPKLRKGAYFPFGPLIDPPDRSMPSAPGTHSSSRAGPPKRHSQPSSRARRAVAEGRVSRRTISRISRRALLMSWSRRWVAPASPEARCPSCAKRSTNGYRPS